MIDGQNYQRRQSLITANIVALALRMMRRFGIPLTGPQRQQMAQRMLPEVEAARAQSYVLATRYMDYTATVADVHLPPVATLEPYDPGALVAVLERTTAPVQQLVEAVQAQASRLTIAQAVESAPKVQIHDLRTGLPIVDLDEDPSDPRVIVKIGNATGAAAARHANQAGRRAVLLTAQQAGHRVGWARVTKSQRPCGFCAMLASRGPVYRSEASANFRAHDRCMCWATLVWDGESWDGEHEYMHWDRVWRTATKGQRGKGAIRAMRRAVDAQNRAHLHRLHMDRAELARQMFPHLHAEHPHHH